MRRGVWILWTLVIVGVSWAAAPQAWPAAEELVEVRVRGVTVDPQGASPVVLLQELRGDRVMPIWVGVFEARAIAMQMEQVVPPRPMTHDLLKDIIQGVHARVTNVVITALKENTFYAQIALAFGTTTVQIDARPSDAIALALRVNAPIFVARAVFDSAPAVDLQAERPTPIAVLKHDGLTLQNLTAPLATHFRLAAPEGVLISDVAAGSGAAHDGLRRGDVIVGADQEKIADLGALESTLRGRGDVTLQVIRQQQRLSVVLHRSAP